MEVERKAFLAALEKVEPALAGTSTSIPALLHIWFDGRYASAFDGSLGIAVPQLTDFRLGVLGRPFLGLLTDSAAEQIKLSYDKKLKLGLGRSSIVLATAPSEDTPWPFVDPKQDHGWPTFPIDEEVLNALRSVLSIKATRPTRVEHEGVCVYRNGKSTQLITTDSAAVCQATISKALPQGIDRILLRFAFVEQIVAKCQEGATLVFLDKCLLATGQDIRVYTTLLDYAQLIDLPGLVKKHAPPEQPRASIPPGLRDAVAQARRLAQSDKDAELELGVDGKQLQVVGKYPLGTIDSAFDLDAELPPRACLKVNLPNLHTAMEGATHFGSATNSLSVYGPANWVCIIAGHTN
jgi:hypothetical protein